MGEEPDVPAERAALNLYCIHAMPVKSCFFFSQDLKCLSVHSDC